MKTACCFSLGCSENRLDGSLIRQYLMSNDWTLVDDPAGADLVILNSCAFTREMERDSLEAYRKLRSLMRPDARLVFGGCLPAINRQAVRDAGHDGVLVTPRTLHLLDAVIEAQTPIDEIRSGCIPFSSDDIGLSFGYSSRRPFSLLLAAVRTLVTALGTIPGFPVPRWLWQVVLLPDRDTELVRISVGCLSQCSFCSIPRAKGLTRSVPPDIVAEQVLTAVRRGKRQIALSCDELASYGQDLGTDIAALLDRLTALPGEFSLILRNVHPEWMIRYWARLRAVFSRRRISYIILPLQSGSDTILRSMKRNHTGRDFSSLIEDIRRVSPETIIRTHLLVGFPGETESDFEETRRLVRDLPVDSFCVHCYSEQDSAPSARLPGKVPPDVIRRRARSLRRLEWTTLRRSFRWLPLRPPEAFGRGPRTATPEER